MCRERSFCVLANTRLEEDHTSCVCGWYCDHNRWHKGDQQLKKYLQKHFQINDLGSLKYCWHIKVFRSKKIFLCHKEVYTRLAFRSWDAKMQEYWFSDGREHKAAIRSERDSWGILEDIKRDRRLVKKMNYLRVIRRDIAFTVSIVSEFLLASRTTHLEAVMRILR